MVLRANWVFLQSRTGGNHNEAGYRVNQEFEVGVSLIESLLAKFQLHCWKASGFEYSESNDQKPKLHRVHWLIRLMLKQPFKIIISFAYLTTDVNQVWIVCQ